GDEALAREHYTAQHDILVKLVGPEHPLVAGADNNLGLTAEAEGRLDAAERYYRESVRLFEQSLGPDHPRVAIALSNLGATLHKRNKPAETLAAFQRALAINTARFGPDYPDSLDALLGEGESLVALGRPKEARAPIARALKMASSGEPQLWGQAEARFALAEALWASGGDRARAHALAVEARKGMAGETSTLARRLVADIDAWLAQH
ncbi:MAG TPA: tetratricopeptide repeat protein, partial [Ideonella sp.]|nr:tetratricopeptide repeat protein [Ideonella sp.]